MLRVILVDQARGERSMDAAERRGELIRKLEDAMALAEELKDDTTAYLIERAIDQARADQFRLPPTA
jgi:DNA-binding ferritin-like protein